MYKIAVLNGRLASSELSIMYSQLGGYACFPLQFNPPDLLCQRCRRPLILLLQHVSPGSTATIHRVTYTFICNSVHCADTGLALTVNIPYHWKEKTNSLIHPLVPQQSLLEDVGNASTDLLGALKRVELSVSVAPESSSVAASLTTEQDDIPYTKICSLLPAFDLRSYPVEQEQVRLALGEIEQVKISNEHEDEMDDEQMDGTPMEILQQLHPKAMVLYGYDMPPLLPSRDEQAVADQIDLAKYIHECDIFPTVISALQLHKHGSSADDSAEFRMISVWGARSMEPGVHFGHVYVVPEEEVGSYFGSN
ncbi:Hypothetical protein GLP15_2145 [Giardia lamblia P15]|uniref:Programmed cell death protein 2 C-terminal domain-containing protein n=1 Tax=Giardia intestinalis (strain P15) TaxID=658858 RepID=E1F6Z9_GIAIA|nr:Hypothetical protein GLP15_2145 [Giardia lamblia P15]